MFVYRSREIPLRFNSSSSTAAICFRVSECPVSTSLLPKSVTVASNQLAFEVEIFILVQLWCLLLPMQLSVNPFARVRGVVQIALVTVIAANCFKINNISSLSCASSNRVNIDGHDIDCS